MSAALYSAGLDLGGTLTKIALVAQGCDILASQRLPTAAHRAPEAVLAELRSHLEKLAAASGLPYPPPAGCGLGLPGVVEHEAGRVRHSFPLDWHDVELGRIAAGALGCEVAVDNDVNAGALADLWFGEARASRDMIYVSWGTGIGAAFVAGRRLYHSRGEAMCNFGHVPADPVSDRLCYCGCQGCLEVEAGGRAMVQRAMELLALGEPSALLPSGGDIDPERIAFAAAAGDALARRILERSGVLMARALAGLLSFLNPDTVIFGGGVSRCLPLIREAFDQELRLRTPNFSLPLTRIVQSSFVDDAGMVGAALLPRQRSLSLGDGSPATARETSIDEKRGREG